MSPKPELLLNQRFEHPEGIVWDARRRRLLWVDIFRGHVLTHDLNSGSLETLELGQLVGAVAPRRAGGCVCTVRTGFGLISPQGEFSAAGAQLHDEPHLQMNDGGVDAHGRFWAGSMTFEHATRPGAGALHRLDPDGTVSTQLPGVSISNGIGWSPDSKSCYYVDSATRRVDRFDYDLGSGQLGKRRTLAEVKALPDGLAVDVDGCIWVAMYEGWEVHRFTPSGKVDRVIRLPGSLVTTCAFGGDDLRTLFIAVSRHGMSEEAVRGQTAGYIFAMDAGVQGLPTHEYAG
jgi:sugar lactone lactonase YvrE